MFVTLHMQSLACYEGKLEIAYDLDPVSVPNFSNFYTNFQ